MDYLATQKYILISPKKLRAVARLAKSLKPTDAIEKLPFIGKKASTPLIKVIKTAIANAKQRGANPDDLVFTEIQIGEGPRLKRFKAGSRGRAKPYKRKMSHIRVVLATPKSQIPNSKSMADGRQVKQKQIEGKKKNTSSNSKLKNSKTKK